MHFVTTIISPIGPSILVLPQDKLDGPVSLDYTPPVHTETIHGRNLVAETYTFSPDHDVVGVQNRVGSDNDQIYMGLFARLIDFGLLLTDTTVQITITNLTIDSVEITDVAWLSDIGVTTTLTTGTTLVKNQSKVFEITALSSTGRSTVDSIFTITFDNGSTLTINLLILRVSSLVYSLIPDRRSYSESYTYKTEIVEFTTGVESRRQLMTTPKRTVSYSVTLTNNSITEYSKSISQLSMHVPFVQPFWFYKTLITIPHTTSSIITFNTIGLYYEVGGYCVIISDQMYPVLLRVTAVEDNYIQVNVPFKMLDDFYVLPAVPMFNKKAISNSYDTYTTNTIKYDLTEF